MKYGYNIVLGMGNFDYYNLLYFLNFIIFNILVVILDENYFVVGVSLL